MRWRRQRESRARPPTATSRHKLELLAATFPETTAESLLPVLAPDDVVQRVNAVVTAIVDIIERTEPQQRAMLRLSLGDVPHELPLRQGRAIKWLSEALEPLRDELGDDGVRSLALALRSVCGIEARVWLRDIGGLESDDIRALQLWMTNALIIRAADEAPPCDYVVGGRKDHRNRRARAPTR